MLTKPRPQGKWMEMRGPSFWDPPTMLNNKLHHQVGGPICCDLCSLEGYFSLISRRVPSSSLTLSKWAPTSLPYGLLSSSQLPRGTGGSSTVPRQKEAEIQLLTAPVCAENTSQLWAGEDWSSRYKNDRRSEDTMCTVGFPSHDKLSPRGPRLGDLHKTTRMSSNLNPSAILSFSANFLPSHTLGLSSEDGPC